MSKRVGAICLSDVHATLTPPIARSVEEDWLAAQDRQFAQIRAIQEEHDCIVIIAGDLGDRSTMPPELVNFLMDALPKKCYAVPGNHDLKNGSYALIRETSYWTLCKAGVIFNLRHNRPHNVDNFILHGFPEGTKIGPPRRSHDLCIEVAVIHKYMWRDLESQHIGADSYSNVSFFYESLTGYDIAIVGDNHIPWHTNLLNGCKVSNCGAFLRRKSDERDYKPAVVLIMSDGTIERRELDVSQDKFLEREDVKKIGGIDVEGFLGELASLGDTPIQFREAIDRAMSQQKVSEGVRLKILEAMEGKK
jgi:DNA repair exonuclease SbcCD nuclease subunit